MRAAITKRDAAPRLQFGCGVFPAEDWINTDLAAGPGVDTGIVLRRGRHVTDLLCPAGEHELALTALVPPTARLTVVSPHLDDGVLGCGDLLHAVSDAVVLTVFAGRPTTYPARTSWDERAGFAPDADVVAARRAEDERALAALGARARWLDFPDPQYGVRPARHDLADALATALDALEPGVVVAPLGLFHDDHILASDAALDALGRHPSSTWLVYADAIYRALPDLVARRLETLVAAGLTLSPLSVPPAQASEQKRRAVDCYRSQVRALERSWDGGVSDAFRPERFWQIAGPGVTSAPRVSVGGERHGNGR